METIFNEIFTTEGRINRFPYFKYQVILLAASFAVGFVFNFIGALLTGTTDSLIGLVPTGVFSLCISVGSIMLGIRRLHDLEKSGWFMLLVLIPFVNIIFGLYLLLASGTVGYNKYGSDPLTR